MDLTTTVFWIFSAAAIITALLCITSRSAIAAALWLVSSMFSLAGLFVLLNAQFIAAIQVIVYAGAVMVLFLFVIMLLNLDEPRRRWRRRWLAVPAVAIGAVMLAQLVTLGSYTPQRLAEEFSTMPNPQAALVLPEGRAALDAFAQHGVVGAVARPLFQGYLVPFEITSVLLLVAVIGAVVLAKKRL